ncbi:MAG: hypothetical protein HY822_22630 [Acidobacteria bacterium]|nr:hypothetical protein [Acidobacteriota bacterium]
MCHTLTVLLLAAAALGTAPQKVRTFYEPGDPAVPAALRADPAPMPVGSVSVVAVASDGAVWLGSDEGLIRYDPRAPEEDRRQYFAGRRYLPDDRVRNLVSDRAAGVWVRTESGVAHIELRPMTLEQKAAAFEERIRARHDRHGMVADSRLREPGNLATNQPVSSDNDGLWTAMYGAAECFRYGATKSPEALASARKAIEAVLFLEQVTGRPGFPARSYVRKDEQRPADGEWHWTADGAIQWKGDTSSDEIVGHFYLFGVAWDLLPPGDALRPRIAATAGRIMDHILDHGYYLVDLDGQPTRWGRWTPEYFATPDGKSDSPLNALELLSFLKTAEHITGKPRYRDEYRKVAFEMRYAELTTRLLELREELNYSDEELAMLPFYLLFRYERDPKLLELYRTALDQWWRNIQREKNPLWTFIYLQGRPRANADLKGAVRTLERIPMDLVAWTVKNSHRKDVRLAPAADRFGRPESLNLLPPDERPVMKWNGNPFRIDGGNGGRSEDDGAFFLLPYWMGRYHKLLSGE